MGLFPAAQLPGALPGEELIVAGIAALLGGDETVEALVVSVGAPRLRQLGLDLPATIPGPEDRLFALLEARYGEDAHSRYNALLRQLVSFERAAECLV